MKKIEALDYVQAPTGDVWIVLPGSTAMEVTLLSSTDEREQTLSLSAMRDWKNLNRE